LRRGALWRRASAGVDRHDHAAEGREREGTACMEHAALADFHAARRQDRRTEPAETCDAVTGGGAEAGTAHCPGSDGDGTV
jgi:hypothetical protein